MAYYVEEVRSEVFHTPSFSTTYYGPVSAWLVLRETQSLPEMVARCWFESDATAIADALNGTA